MNTYNIVNGTGYDERTEQAVIDVLESARRNNTRIILTYGDKETGVSWLDEYDITGTVGRSTGQIKIPLIINNSRSHGGPGMLDHCIIRIRTAQGKHVLYQAKNFISPSCEIVESDLKNEGYTHNLNINGSTHSRHRSLASAQRLQAILQ